MRSVEGDEGIEEPSAQDELIRLIEGSKIEVEEEPVTRERVPSTFDGFDASTASTFHRFDLRPSTASTFDASTLRRFDLRRLR
jgi:hypothetical protein